MNVFYFLLDMETKIKMYKRRNGISFGHNKVNPVLTTFCQICNYSNGINVCAICKLIICCNHTFYSKKQHFCTKCMYEPNYYPYIQAICIDDDKPTIKTRILELVIYIFSYKWFSSLKH